jgi:hypothetical protein
MYYVFRALADFVDGEVQVSPSSQPLKVESLVIRKGEKQRIVLANLSASPQTVTLKNRQGTYDLRLLDAENALGNVDEFWQTSQKTDASIINLAPYALAFLDYTKI